MLNAVTTDQLADVRFRLLVPVWGERYINGFCEIALPALLAKGNLPALLQNFECEVIFLTTRESVSIFKKNRAYAALSSICANSFIYIDDLLPFVDYGIILTTAYGRGIASLGDRQLSTYFVFLNADFVLSDGILQTVVDRVKAGFRGIMAPSLRCNEEDVAHQLRERVFGDGSYLAEKPEDLVRLTLAHLHPTVLASIVNEAETHHIAANMFFWRVDQETLIGRYFLLFMLCIRPEHMFSGPVGWCDYSFMPELVPSENFDIICDSADGFILEMQARRGDAHYVRAGKVGPLAYSKRLSHWTTAYHRKYASTDIVFHTGAVPASTDGVKIGAAAFMDKLLGSLRRRATSHLRHPYWVGAVTHHQRRLGVKNMPAEYRQRVRPIPSGPITRVIALKSYLWNCLTAAFDYIERKFVGRLPHPGKFHYAYLDYTNFKSQISKYLLGKKKVLYVLDHASPLDAFIEGCGIWDRLTTEDIKSSSDLSEARVSYDGVIISLHDIGVTKLHETMLSLGSRCNNSIPVLVCLNGVSGVFFHARFSLSGDIALEVAANPLPMVKIETMLMVGEKARLSCHYKIGKCFQLMRGGGFVVYLCSYIVITVEVFNLLYINLTRSAKNLIAEEDVCTSATILLSGPWEDLTLAAERGRSN